MIVREIPSHVKDTSDFLQKLNTVESIPDNSYLVSLDVKSLYTSIPNSECIKAVKKSLDNHPQQRVATKVITTFLILIVTLNNFIFNSRNYVQTKKAVLWEPSVHLHTPIYLWIFLKKNLYTHLSKGSP